MKYKAKIVTVASVSFFLLNVMQIAIASIDPEKALVTLELTDRNMDTISAGSGASATAHAQGNFTTTLTTANTGANTRTNYAVSSAVAAFCCDDGSASTRANTSANGNTVRTDAISLRGANYSASWSVSQGY